MKQEHAEPRYPIMRQALKPLKINPSRDHRPPNRHVKHYYNPNAKQKLNKEITDKIKKHT